MIILKSPLFLQTKAVQNRNVMHGQEIKEKEIITVRALQKGLIQPKKRKMENVRNIVRQPEEVSLEVSYLFLTPSPSLNTSLRGNFGLNIY